MRSLQKSQEPEVLARNRTSWTESYVEAARSKRTPIAYWRRRPIPEVLLAETDRRCAYCDSHVIHVAQPHIEHYRPRKSYPELVVAWDNLTVACPRCNALKLDNFSEKLPLVNPFIDDPMDHFIFYGDMVFAPESLRGEYTIQILGLNREDIVSMRKQRMLNMERLVASWRKAPPVLRNGILSEIHVQFESGEYEASVRTMLQAFGVPLPNKKQSQSK
ncbi:HNH endonuclease [Arthrobacter jiangjiafuii]|uniref:HNH endonuclease n=1 Tax=Arthrobacter jiangjiafuii TaxID=2817475 RepID=A0A975R1P1_9MICC|nr:HNH endonuclease [Arthrobacter jiangjiafuii]MBP3043665.1 HNH endonuclease [Arthrobacter jiangjiafuii]QWC10701.1 HNH endonuclease [Arthrobacter jiangjiafuii]